MKKSKRLSWDEYALMLAYDASQRSEDPFIKVGACGLDKNHHVLGTGYNGLAPGKKVKDSFWNNRDYRRPYMVHAEMNFISHKAPGRCKVLASTLLPCSCCAVLIAANKIKRVVFGEIYQRDTKSIDIFSFYGIELVQLEDFYGSIKRK